MSNQKRILAKITVLAAVIVVCLGILAFTQPSAQSSSSSDSDSNSDSDSGSGSDSRPEFVVPEADSDSDRASSTTTSTTTTSPPPPPVPTSTPAPAPAPTPTPAPAPAPVVVADKPDRIIIELSNATYAPLTKDPKANQVKLYVAYETQDLTLRGSNINGVMDVFAANGTQIKTSSHKDGFNITGSGIIEFATTFRDPNVTAVSTNTSFTSLDKVQRLSNFITANVSLTP